MSPPLSAKSPSSASLYFLIAAVVLIHLLSATWHIFTGSLNADEGFYAIATRSVAHGEMPYRDFGFTQPPLVLYANALPLRFLGFGLFPQRALNGAWTALALLVAARWLARRTQPLCALGFVLLFSLSAPWMYFSHLGKTYGFTTLLVMVAAWVFLTIARCPRRNFALGLLFALGAATRLPAIPFFGVLWLLALWPASRPTLSECGAALGGLGAGLSVALLPFFVVAREAARFWIVDFHRASVPLKDWSVPLSEVIALSPGVWLFAVAAFAIAIFRRRLATREAGLFLAAGLALFFNLFPGGAYQEYGVPFLLPLGVASAALICDAVKTWPRPLSLAFISTVAAAHLLFAPLLPRNLQSSRSRTASAWLSPQIPAYNPRLPAQLAAARRIVEQSLAPTAPFIGPNLILAAETGRDVPAALRMGPFSFTLEIPPEQAARLHLATHEDLDAWFARPDVTLLALFKRRELNYGWSMPSFDQLREDFHAQWFAPLRRDFAPAYESGDDFVLLVRKP